MRVKNIAIGMLIGGMFFMTGCSTKTMQATNTGFFDDYTEFDKTQVSKPELKKYKKIIITPVEIISVNLEEKRTPRQKELYADVANYVNTSYKKDIQAGGNYEIVDEKSSNTLILQTAISAVEVHFEDKDWNQFSPIPLDINVVSYSAYKDKDVRILGEVKLIDASSGEIIFKGLNIQENEKIIVAGRHIELEDLIGGLNSWLAQIRDDLEK